MKKIYLLFFLLPLLAKSQRKQKIDSAWYYQSEMSKMTRAAMDSVQKSPEYIAYQKKYRQYIRKSNDYAAFTVFTEYAHADYRALNNSIAASGFPALTDISARIGFGLSMKEKHFMFNLFYAIFGINNTSVHNGEKIKTASNDLFHFDLGYDLLSSKTFSIYPYAGLSLRSSTLRYEKDAQINTNYTNITDIINNDQSVSASSTKVGYHAGIAFDIRLGRYSYAEEEDTHVPTKTGRMPIILFVKFGTNLPIGKETYKIHGIKYRPDIRQGDWGITVGVKFP